MQWKTLRITLRPSPTHPEEASALLTFWATHLEGRRTHLARASVGLSLCQSGRECGKHRAARCLASGFVRQGDARAKSMTVNRERRGPRTPPPNSGQSQIREPPGRRKAGKPRGQTLSPARDGPSFPNPLHPQRSLAQALQVSPLSQVDRLAADHPPCCCASAMLSSDSVTSSTSSRPKQPPIRCGQQANSDAWASVRGNRSDPGPRQTVHNEERPSR